MARRRQRLLAIVSPCAVVLLVAACNALVGLDRDFILTTPGDSAGSTSAEANGDGPSTTTDGSSGGSTDADAISNADVADGTTTPDADAGPPPAKVIHCASASNNCTVGTQICCSNVSAAYQCDTTVHCTCAPPGSCTQIHLDCDDETDCSPGEVCCATFATLSDDYTFRRSSCIAAQNCLAAGGQGPLCDITVPGGCRDGGTCKQFTDDLFPGVGRCR